MLAALIVCAVSDIRDPQVLNRWLQRLPPRERDGDVPPPTTAETPAADTTAPESPVDWPQALAARGTATRLGDALAHVIQHERGGPVAGISMLTDGNENQGKPLREAAELARRRRHPRLSHGSRLAPTARECPSE